MSSQPPQSTFEHTVLPNGIYQFVFLKNNRQTVDHYIAVVEPYFDAFANGTLGDTKLRVIIELRESGMTPVAYMAGKDRDMLLRHPVHVPARVVYLYTGGFLLSVARSFLALLPTDPKIIQRQ